MHTYKLLADGLDQQCGNYRRVYTAGKCQQHLFVSNLLLYRLHLFCDKCFRKSRCRNSFHGFRAFIIIHSVSSIGLFFNYLIL